MEKIRVPLTEAAVSRSSVDSSGELVMKLMHSRTWTHLAHLSAQGPGAYELHIALNAYYDGIVGLTDRLVECAQGIYAQILTYPQVPFEFTVPFDALAYLDALRVDIESIIGNIDHPALNNITAEILELLGSTVYKLRFLK